MSSTYTARQPGRGGKVILRYDTKLHASKLGQTGIAGFGGEAETTELAETGLHARAGNILQLAIEGEGIGVEVGRARGSGVRAEVVL